MGRHTKSAAADGAAHTPQAPPQGQRDIKLTTTDSNVRKGAGGAAVAAPVGQGAVTAKPAVNNKEPAPPAAGASKAAVAVGSKRPAAQLSGTGAAPQPIDRAGAEPLPQPPQSEKKRKKKRKLEEPSAAAGTEQKQPTLCDVNVAAVAEGGGSASVKPTAKKQRKLPAASGDSAKQAQPAAGNRLGVAVKPKASTPAPTAAAVAAAANKQAAAAAAAAAAAPTKRKLTNASRGVGGTPGASPADVVVGRVQRVQRKKRKS
jgi:hypothetical protein